MGHGYVLPCYFHHSKHACMTVVFTIYYILYITYCVLHIAYIIYTYMSHNWLWVLRDGIENERHVSPPDMVIFADKNQVAYPLVICYIATLKMAPS